MTEAVALLRFLRSSLGLSTPAVVAGGFARDQILGNRPRDIDVFLLGGGLLSVVERTVEVAQVLAFNHLPHSVEPKLYRTADGVPAFGPPINFQFLQWPVQLICTPCSSPTDVVGSFDYNVCQFWLDENDLAVGLSAQHLYDLVARDMRLLHTRTPWSSLRRGILMADRFGFTFREDDKRRLVEALHAELTA